MCVVPVYCDIRQGNCAHQVRGERVRSCGMGRWVGDTTVDVCASSDAEVHIVDGHGW